MSFNNGKLRLELGPLDKALSRAAERERALLKAEQDAEALVIKRLRQRQRAGAKVRRAQAQVQRRQTQLAQAQTSLTEAHEARARGPLAEREAD